MVEVADNTNGIPISVTKPLKHDSHNALEDHFHSLSIDKTPAQQPTQHRPQQSPLFNTAQQQQQQQQQRSGGAQYAHQPPAQSYQQTQYTRPQSDFRQQFQPAPQQPSYGGAQRSLPQQSQMPLIDGNAQASHTQSAPHHQHKSFNHSSNLSATATPFEFLSHATTQPIDRLGYQHMFQADTKRDSGTEQKLFSSGNHAGIDFDRYDDIPVEVTGNDVVAPVDTFAELTFPDVMNENIALCQYKRPTPIQKHALPAAWLGRDLMCCSQTGSGKTAAFLLPLIAALVTRGRAEPGQSAYRRAYPVGLVLAPTRELATQIYDEACKFTYRTGYAPVVVYGGADPKFQSQELSYGCDILIATPGRLVDFIQRGRISMSQVGYLVFDEADRMLDMGFEPQIRQILHQSDMNHMSRQTLMFSATFPKTIQRLAADFLHNYLFIAVGRVGSAAELVSQSVEYVDDTNKPHKLLEVLRGCEGLTLVFVERKKQANELERWLCRHGVTALSIHGDKSQYEREYALDMFKSGQCNVLVATDVAARGLDINHVTDVINFDLPTNIDDYVHRIGRTGRAGNTGKAHAFFNEKNLVIGKELCDLLAENKQPVPDFLQQMVSSSRGSSQPMRGGRGGRGRGRGNFGGTDYRQANQYGMASVRGGAMGFTRGGGAGGGGLLQQARQYIASHERSQQQPYTSQPSQYQMPMQSVLPTHMPQH